MPQYTNLTAISLPQYEVVRAHIKQLLEAQIIRESSRPYSSLIVLLQKKDGGIRMCVDYHQLNMQTGKDAFPLPRIEESLDSLTGAQGFSTLDSASGYSQVEVAEQDRPKTTFCTPFWIYEFSCMLFGLCNAPSTFQDLMKPMFRDCHYQSILYTLTLGLCSRPQCSNIYEGWKKCFPDCTIRG